jgi:hypothetical protein
MGKIISIIAIITMAFTFSACSNVAVETSSPTVNDPQKATTIEENYVPVSVEYSSYDLDSSWDSADSTLIKLEENSASINGKGVLVDSSRITITAGGTYIISGNLDDGQLIVNSEDTSIVHIVLNSADITCSTSAPIYIISAKKTVVTLADGTINQVKDGDSYTLDDTESEEPNAAIFSKDDLTINGSGSLIVTASYNNGIQSKDDLKVTGGNITVSATNNGIKGKDLLAIKDSNLIIDTSGDGLQSSNDSDSEKGFISIESGTLNITAGEDGIQAETSVLIGGGDITIVSGGGSINNSTKETWGDWGNRISPQRTTIPDFSITTTTNSQDNSSDSAKGIKAGINVTINESKINIDSSDDSIHSNGSLTISDSKIILSSGDDGIHSDSTLEINSGDITISKSYEGIESSTITINGGTLHIVASDDGINAAGGVDGSSINGRPGQNTFESFGSNYLYLHGGYIYVDADGDGIDINGSITMTDGFVIVNGPTNNNNGALDYLGEFKVTGGALWRQEAPAWLKPLALLQPSIR